MTVKHQDGPARRAFEETLKGFGRLQTEIGWFESSKYPDGTPVAYVASIQEYGHAPIPPRPFIRPTISGRRKRWMQYLEQQAKASFAGNTTAFAALDSFGGMVAGEIRQAITKIKSPPLSPITVTLRKWKKEHKGGVLKINRRLVGAAAAAVNSDNPPDLSGVSTKPLVDTGYMLATLTHNTSDARVKK